MARGGNQWTTSVHCPGPTGDHTVHFEVSVSEGGESGGHNLLLGGRFGTCALCCVWHNFFGTWSGCGERAGWVLAIMSGIQLKHDDSLNHIRG